MAKFRKRPVIVEATQWFPGKMVSGVTEMFNHNDNNVRESAGYGFVVTIHGQHTKVVSGDYVITEPNGTNHYPCKPDIFEKNYEKVE